MADKSFEEKVREELAALELKPDAEVWQQVEAAMHKEKKRRWLIWIVAIAAGFGSFLLYHQYQAENKNTVAGHPQKEINKQENSKQLAAPVLSHNGNPQLSFTNRTDIPVNGSSVLPGNPVTTTKDSILADIMPIQHFAEQFSGRSTRIQQDMQEPAKDTGKKSDTEQAKTITATAAIVKTQVTMEPDSTPAIIQEQMPLSLTAGRDTFSPAKNNDLTITKTTARKTDKHRWQLYGTLDIGKSGERSSLVNTQNVYAANPSNSAGVPGGSVGGASNSYGTAVLYKIPSQDNAFSFGLAVQAARSVGGKNSIGISLGYTLYQSFIGIGRRIDTTLIISGINRTNANGFLFISTDTARYLNKYHFAELAFDYYTQFKLAKTIPLRWRVGTAVAVLLSGDALHYDATLGILFKSSSLLSPFQMNISTGLDIGIGKQPGIYIGPQLTYFLGKNSKQPGSEQHFFRPAIRATVAFPKKKK